MNAFLPSGRFAIGANYWASHAGLAMWRDWRPEVIDQDFALLAAEGLQVLRVFPLWPDFQPITLLRSAHGRPVEFRHGEALLPDDKPVQDGVSGEMLDRFAVMADLAGKHGFDLIVGLVTGWMSGRFFVPPALEGLNPITDPLSQMWQIRLARALVGRFKEYPAIKAWDLGNECNVMGLATREQAWLWTAGLTNAIRCVDPSRPVVSGMHSLSADPKGAWSIRDQGEITDILTTHPYPLFTSHCHRESLNTMRPILHATAETLLYADLGSKPAFVEEFGSLGPMICGEDESAAFVRASLASLWAHDCRGALWWCAHDQLSLDYAPYDWAAVERELGLVREDRTPKPVLREMHAFRQAEERMPFSELPPCTTDAVCILTAEQDQWGVAYSAFVLAKQAGFDLRFHFQDRALPDASLYLLPSLGSLSRRREEELWARVRAGATAYVSLAGGLLGRFAEATGAEVLTRSERRGECHASLAGGASFRLPAQFQYELKLRTADAIAREADGRPLLCKNRLGEGEVFLLTIPLEAAVATIPQAFEGDDSQPLWLIYGAIAGKVLGKRIVRKSNPWIGITEHILDERNSVAILINYSPRQATDVISLPEGFQASGCDGSATPVSDQHYGINLPPNGFAVWQIRAEGH